MTDRSSIEILFDKLSSIYTLGSDDRDALRMLPMQVTSLRSDQDIVREGDRPSRCCIILEGFARWSKITGNAKRQILNFHIPGDIPDLHSLHLAVLDSTLTTLTPCKVGFIQHEVVRDLCEKNPNIASALWRSTLIDAAIFREWVANLGARPGYNRVGHLLCEMMVRLKAVGLGNGQKCPLPITQLELGDATGLSLVHVNRTLKEWKDQHQLTLLNGVLTIPDWRAATEAADFDPTYLHLKTA